MKRASLPLQRREFITLVGSAVAAWPVVALAQQSKAPVVGFLNPTSPDTNAGPLRAFRQGLKEVGYVEGENVEIDYRWAENQIDRFSTLVADFVRRPVAVIATTGGAASAFAAKAATTTIPIVFMVPEDPVKLGLVASLARPGGNVTGVNLFTSELVAKRLEFLRELVPRAAHVAVLVNPANAATTESTLRDVQPAARAMGLQIQIVNASTRQEIDATFAALVQDRSDALYVGNDPFLISRRVQLVHLASRHAVPAIYSGRQYAEIGGLISYGTNLIDAYRQFGVYTGRILKGEKLAELPVMQASTFELVINAQTARMLSLTVPATLLARADEVIE